MDLSLSPHLYLPPRHSLVNFLSLLHACCWSVSLSFTLTKYSHKNQFNLEGYMSLILFPVHACLHWVPSLQCHSQLHWVSAELGPGNAGVSFAYLAVHTHSRSHLQCLLHLSSDSARVPTSKQYVCRLHAGMYILKSLANENHSFYETLLHWWYWPKLWTHFYVKSTCRKGASAKHVNHVVTLVVVDIVATVREVRGITKRLTGNLKPSCYSLASPSIDTEVELQWEAA